MKFIQAFLLVTLALPLTAFAQEGEAKLIDEVIARVNSTPVMRSTFEREQKEQLEALKQRGLKGEELEKQFNDLKARLLDSLIDTQLLVQRAKDLTINVEPQVNEQLRRIMKENNIASLEDLEQKMREVGVDINEVRRNLGDRFASQAVIQREVQYKIYQNLAEKDKRDFYEKNKEAFAVPGEVTLSVIMIAFGKDQAGALTRIKDILAQARSGASDFPALAKRFSEDAGTAAKGGTIGALQIPQLAPEIREAIDKAKAGDVTEPIKLPNGYAIYRVDQLKESQVRSFDEREVQEAAASQLTYERSEKQIEEYLSRLRTDAFIEIDPRYQFGDSKVKSAQIKRVPYSEENKKKKKKDKEKDEKAQNAEKPAVAKP